MRDGIRGGKSGSRIATAHCADPKALARTVGQTVGSRATLREGVVMRVRLLVVLPLLAVGVPAQAEWVLEHHSTVSAGPQSLHALAYDTARERLVLYGGSEIPMRTTWEWNGAEWNEKTSRIRPTAVQRHKMVYDAARARVLLFGGLDANGDALAETWEWDGTSWSQLMPATSPPARSRHALAYDATRERVVLFGGSDGTDSLADTWEWDGADWTLASPMTVPAARRLHAMAYDQGNGEVVLFSGWDSGVTMSDTWVWGGVDWVEQSPATVPPGVFAHDLAYDSARGRVVSFGGFQPGGPSASTWEWDGTNWAQSGPGTSPPARIDHATAYDQARGEVILFGGWDGNLLNFGDTWGWGGSDWQERGAATGPGGGVTSSPAMAFDSERAVTVLVGGDGPHGVETWEWDGDVWVERSPAVRPPARQSFAMTYDSARKRTVVFGGIGFDGTILSDTWEWDGSDWAELFPATVPPRRYSHDMVYDDARGYVVLFGGRDQIPETKQMSDTWEWDGTEWSLRSSSTEPPSRFNHTMAFDSPRQKVVLFGGGIVGEHTDTWEWDGQEWKLIDPFDRPPTGTHHAMTYDAGRNQIVLVGGTLGLPAAFRNTWEYDGANWFRRAVGNTPPAASAVAYDSARGRVVEFHADGGQFDTWEYYTTSVATVANFGEWCAGTSGSPGMAAAPGQRPWVGSLFRVALSSLPDRALNVTIALLGFSKSAHGPISLPLDLTPLGLYHCTQYVSIDFHQALVISGRSALWNLQVPDDVSLNGLTFYLQSLVSDFGANAANFIATNAVEATIGIR